MSLATRCIACGTIFRIVQDQIKVSEGWVRCGRCDTVFNALEGLFDLDRDTPPPFAGGGAAPGPDAGAEVGSDGSPAVGRNVPASDGFLTAPEDAAAVSHAGSLAGPPHGTPGDAVAAEVPDDPYGFVHEPTLPMSLDELPRPQDYGLRQEAADSVIPQPEVRELVDGASGHSVLPSGYPAMTRSPREEPFLSTPMPAASATAGMNWEELVAHEARSFYAGQGRDDEAVVHSDFEDARFPADAATDFGDGASQPAPDSRLQAASRLDFNERAGDSRQAPITAVEIPLIDEPAPEFVRQADRRAFWQRGPVRLALGLAALVCAAGLAAQVSLHWRDTMAVRWPATKPWLAAACGRLGCKLAPPREIDQIVVESTALTRVNASDAYRLTVVLRNRAEHGVAAPHLDLSLTEVNGGLVARRALSPADFRNARSELPPRTESTFELTLSTGALRVAGYTVAVFYP